MKDDTKNDTKNKIKPPNILEFDGSAWRRRRDLNDTHVLKPLKLLAFSAP